MPLLNRYEYSPQTDIAGKGEFSRVYKAVDVTNQETVAVKIYRINELSDHYHAIQDGEIIRTFEHPALCRYIDIRQIEKEDSFGEKELLQVCVTSFLEGDNLVDYSRNNAAALKKILPAILNGLSYLHKKGIIHGYLKPSNILVAEQHAGAVAMITDFAMGIVMAHQPSGSRPASFITSVSYRSPEQLNPAVYGIDGKVLFNTDLWSLGVVIYEALTGEPLFAVSNTDFAETVTMKVTSFELPEKIHSLPEPYATLLKRCLVKDARQRAQSAEELLSIFQPEITDQAEILSLENNLEALGSADKLTTLVSTEESTADDTRMIALPEQENITATENSETSNDNDDTRIIARPTAKQVTTGVSIKEEASDGDTKIVSGPAVIPAADGITDGEDTKRLEAAAKTAVNDGITNEELSEDDTKILQPGNAFPMEKPVEEDDATRIVSRSGIAAEINNNSHNKQAAAADDDTKIISRAATGSKPADEDSSVDQTIIIARLKKEKNAAKDLEKNNSDAGSSAGNQSTTGEIKPPDIIIRRREKPVILFNRYEYLPATDLIGKGGFSRVYKAFDKKLSRWVALKIYKTGEFSDRYSPIAEIKRVVNLDHPNICRYLDIEEIENENPFGENEKIQVCVMELLDSGNFADYYKANKSPEVLKKLIQDILNGLSYLHKNGIIHRDIKPANILIKQTIEGPVAKITDFGISKNSEAENNNSSSALIVSIPYMAPEQLNAKKYGINERVSFNLDLWSLGVTIFEVVTGKVLFKNSDQDNSEQIMANIMAPDLPEKLKDLQEPFRTVVAHCVIKNARERAAKAEELMVLLNIVFTPAEDTASLAAQAANANVVTDSSTPQQIKTDKPVINTSLAPEQKSSKSRFAIEEETVKETGKKDDQKRNPLAIFIGTAIVIFILFIIYLKACNQASPPARNEVVVPITDTIHKTITNIPVDSVKVPVVPAKTDTAVKQPADSKPVHPIEKKKEKPAETIHKNEVVKKDKPVSTDNTAARYVLLLSAETSCTLKVNSITYGEIQNGRPLRIYLTTGKYILQFTSSSNSSSTYTANIEVKPENLGHADKFKIPLK